MDLSNILRHLLQCINLLGLEWDFMDLFVAKFIFRFSRFVKRHN